MQNILDLESVGGDVAETAKPRDRHTVGPRAMANEIYGQVFEDAVSEIYVFDARTLRFLGVNARARANLQYTQDELALLTPLDLKPDLTALEFDRRIAPLVIGTRASVAFETRHRRKDGTFYDVEVVVRLVPGKRACFHAYILDISRQKAAQESARRAEGLMIAAIEALPNGFVLFDATDRLVTCNNRYRELHGQSGDAVKPGATFETILRDGMERGHYKIEPGHEPEWLEDRLSADWTPERRTEQEMADGRWLRIFEHRTPDGGRAGFLIDITEQKLQQAELSRMASTDFLTGLLNRRGLFQQLAKLMTATGPVDRIAVMNIDLDKFKAVNDSLGHDAGDRVLRQVAEILLGQILPGDFVARMGGDEFVVVLTQKMTSGAVCALADRLIALLSAPMMVNERTCHLSASIGIAFWNVGQSASPEMVLTNADMALNVAKQSGRSRCKQFEDAMRYQSVRVAEMVQEMREGLRKHEFEAYFQPQFDMSGAKITGFETLVRWNHPRNGVMDAGEFIDVAEHAGLIPAIDTVMCHASS
ncbi:MAG: diguanylate cyclase, partial [Deltaproteobacteria bacterium]